MIALDILKAALILTLIIFVFGFVFGFLFKVGIILLLALSILYMIKKVFLE